jgi:hypothetical protein
VGGLTGTTLGVELIAGQYYLGWFGCIVFGRSIMKKSFKVGDRVSWNSEAGQVSGTITRVHTRDFELRGYTRHATANSPQYEIKSARTDHIAFHKGSALTKLRD